MDSPSAEDLLALVPDMDLLEAAASDALAGPPTASPRKASVTPILSDRNTAATTSTHGQTPGFNEDDPYAALMPEPDGLEEAEPLVRRAPEGTPPPKLVAVPQPAPPRCATGQCAAEDSRPPTGCPTRGAHPTRGVFRDSGACTRAEGTQS